MVVNVLPFHYSVRHRLYHVAMAMHYAFQDPVEAVKEKNDSQQQSVGQQKMNFDLGALFAIRYVTLLNKCNTIYGCSVN